MTEQPLVSIIIPTYNRAELIGETLDSVLAQTYQNWECIVVDDGSSDNTDEVLKNYINKDSRIKYHHRPKQYKPGGNGARNYGFDLSKGEYINWFDSDDVMLNIFISEKIIVSKKNDMVISGHYVTNADLTIKEKKIIRIKDNILKDYLDWKKDFQIVTNNIFFERKFIEINKYRFNEDILRGQEAEFLFRIFDENLESLKYKILNKPLFFYRQHNDSKTNEFNNKNIDFNKSIIKVHFLKLIISDNRGFLSIKKNVIKFLEKFIEHVNSQRDLDSILTIVNLLLGYRTLYSILLAIILILLYPINKYPKFLKILWYRI
ncbi:glycosyltransferase [Empedobacter falsenii]